MLRRPTVAPHCLAPVPTVLPAHLPAEHVWPGAQHTCNDAM